MRIQGQQAYASQRRDPRAGHLPGDVREAGEPALVLSPPLADPVPFEIGCFVVWGNGDLSLPEGTITLARAPTSRLVAVPGGADRLSCTLGEGLDIRPVGGYAAPLIAPR